MKKNIVLSSIATVALVSLVGCGGGSTPPAEEIAKAKAKLSGVAVDDLILNGLVEAKDVDGNSLASGRTSTTDGTYTLDVAHSGVVVVNVSCDANSTMYNPVTDTNATCGDDVVLNSIAAVEEGTPLTVNISPISEIMYQRALDEAGDSVADLTVEDVETARYDIGTMLSVDPIADDPTEGTYADIINAIHTMAEEGNTSVIAVTEELAEALSDGEAEGEDAVVEFSEAMADENLTNHLSDNNGTYTPIAPEVLTNIEEAKALFAELRTQAMSVVDYDNTGTPGFMDTEAVDMEAAISDVAMDIGFMGQFLNYIADEIEYMVEYNLTSSPMGIVSQTSPGNWEYSYKDMSGAELWSGTISVPTVLLGNNAEAELYTAGTLTMTVNGTTPLTYDGLVDEGVTDSQSFEGEISVTKSTTGADISIIGEVASNGTSIALTEATATLGYTESTADIDGNTEPEFDYFKLHNVVLQGIVGGYTIDGSITVNSYAQNAGLAPKGGFEETYNTYYGGWVTCIEGPSNVNSEVKFTLDGIVYTALTDHQGYFWGEIAGEYDYNDFYNVELSGDISVDDSVCQSAVDYIQLSYQGSSWDTKLTNTGWLPDDITFAGAISRTGAELEGTLNAKWLNAATMDMDSEDAMPLVEVAFNGKLQMPDRPEMLATLTFENNETHNTIGGNYTHGSTVINMSALFDTDMNNGDIEVTTHTGLRADLKVIDGDLITDGTGEVTKDGSLVGTLEEREDVPVIKYVDGSFESLP